MWVSPYDPSGYDLGIDDGKRFYRVNVKRATYGNRQYRVARAGCAGQSSTRDPDRYLIWLVDHNQFLELPGDFLAGKQIRSIPLQLIREAIQK